MASKVMTTISETGNSRRRLGGFSLIELSIVVFIIAILVAVSVPSFIRSYNGAVLNATGRAVMTSCQFAKLNAVLHQRNVAFYIDIDKRMIWLTQFSGTNDTESSSEVLKSIEISPRVGVASVQVGDQPPEQRGQAEATFYPERYLRRVHGNVSRGRRGAAWPSWSIP